MLTFILSMRARALAKDWNYHTWLLESTLDSILAQTNPQFDVVVVCHDIPAVRQAGHPAVHMLQVSFPLPERNFDDMLVDKVLKVSRGVEWARSRGSEHVMFVDADDLVSCRLSALVAAQPQANGWYFRTGYAYRYGERWLHRQAPHHLICGTGLIVRTDLLRYAKDDRYRGETVNTLAAAGIAEYVDHLAAQGAPVQPLPFSGAVYILHEDSTVHAPGNLYRTGGPVIRRPAWRRLLSWGKHAAERLARMRPVTPALRAEFSIPKSGYPGSGGLDSC